MTREKLEKIYRVIRIAIFFIPAIAISTAAYLILFPVDSYQFFPDNPKLSKFEIIKDFNSNQLIFGIFPLRSYRYIELVMNFKKSDQENCDKAKPKIILSKTYQAFLYPEGETITTEEQLNSFLFADNKTKYPNGSLLHLKPTNEVFLITRGKKILFPGPEIFRALGYSFENLTDVEQSDIDQFPDADQEIFLWTMPHPDGTIFETFPSHFLYLIFDGKKHQIERKELLDKAWPENFTIPISDNKPENNPTCEGGYKANRLFCRFDTLELPDIGRYFYFQIKFPENCPIEAVHPDNSQIRFISERSKTNAKNSLRNIATSILSRYFYKQ